MTRENVMSTPIFDQLLREMAQRAEPRATPREQAAEESEPQAPAPGRRRHRAE
ncbi:hypothetical protein [Actinophytocola sp. NPDC049390]|uniref:hypothetical protein n=1 Tax=Actinophytocola sp. NPDC049390 TaxID=3363894 RepID=UPI0037AA31C6